MNGLFGVAHASASRFSVWNALEVSVPSQRVYDAVVNGIGLVPAKKGFSRFVDKALNFRSTMFPTFVRHSFKLSGVIHGKGNWWLRGTDIACRS